MRYCQNFCTLIELKSEIEKLLIAAVIPPLLEKGVDWFLHNQRTIESERVTNPWWRRHTALIEAGEKRSVSELLRTLTELGYTKVWEAAHIGEFSQRGGVIHIFPINEEQPVAIEFEGNYIASIAVTSQDAPISSRLTRPDKPASTRFVGSDASRKSTHLAFVPGDYVVHIDHGIGIFRREEQDDFVIEYAPPPHRPDAPDLLYVPKKEIGRIAPYLGFKKPHISRLGTPLWSLTKKKAKEDIVAYAKELLAVLAERKTATRLPYASHEAEEEELEANFLHEDTADQKKALREIFADMEKSEPMDRILTGDVGFGKTELALRAAFRAIVNGKQVALLAPTTILADQHHEVFKSRFDPFGISTVRLTRLESTETVHNIKQRLQSGAIDIVIGTHKLLGKNIMFKNLGLLVIDEEQKFGVAHKERFKKEYPTLDILALSATPIPRTLNMALSGIAAISTIETAPQGRMDVQTFVLPKNKKIIEEAIRHELSRGGQIYFLANRIHRMPKLIMEIETLKIKMKIATLHGRMKENTILKTMHDFRDKKIDMLVSTTIIENGLDISNANTLIVEDATLLGLSGAHQIRGRIGRGDKTAFAYFLYPSQKLKERAAERLEALERYAWRGAGLEIAKRDLEIRGAGNILGKAQSGIAYKVGLNLYFELLEEAVAELKNKKDRSEPVL